MNGSLLAPPASLSRPMTDPFGRTISYLRVSVTDRCDLRCFYCMSEDMTFLPKADLLTLEELDRLCSAFIAKGVRKLRLTGGEPLVRRNVMSLVRSLSRHLETGALNELTLTTNGSQLARFAGELRACGVKRINVSLDTLDPDKFREITRWGDLTKVMAGIEAAKAAGLAVKINAVALKNLEVMEREKLVPRVKNDIGPYMQRRLRETFEGHPIVGEVRGIGLIAAIELVADKKKREFFPDIGDVGTHCRNYCFNSGLVSRAIRDTMVLAPPFIISESEVEEIIAKLKAAIDNTARDYKKM